MGDRKDLQPAGTVILLSGGLDSCVTLAIHRRNTGPLAALYVNYGQIAAKREERAATMQADHYGIEIEKVELPFLSRWSNSALFDSSKLPRPDSLEGAEAIESAAKVWVPARNALLLSVAASFAEARGFGYIAMGCNFEEGATFVDNSSEFAKTADKFISIATNFKVRLSTPLLNLSKADIVDTGLRLLAPLSLIWSCYEAGEAMCGSCESCLRLKRALSGNPSAKSVSLKFTR